MICDFAEYYNIYDYEQMPTEKVGILALGLRDNSRIVQKINGEELSIDLLIQASILDRLSFLAWTKTKDAQKGKNAPASVVDALRGKDKKANDDFFTFTDNDEFFRMREEILKGQ
ncbi:MAG: DUF5361 domain-containing protein [Clostridia bacterium]|nr:DUF5361 domain-containing protein [Clostridia bacterium]